MGIDDGWTLSTILLDESSCQYSQGTKERKEGDRRIDREDGMRKRFMFVFMYEMDTPSYALP